MKKRSMMCVMRADEFGGPEVLKSVEVPIPQPGPGQVLIRVEAASVNFSDVMRRRASPYPFPTSLPYIPGSEVAGRVHALGEGVAGPAEGTPVFAVVNGGEGGYAEYALASAPQVIPIPGDLSADVAAGLVVAGVTAVLLLEEAVKLRTGESVFIAAAAGGVGSIAVQVAKKMGARVLAGASTTEKRAHANGLGADAVVDYLKDDWPAQIRVHTDDRGVDAMLEMRGGDALEQGLSALAPFGRAVVYGSASAVTHRLTQMALDRFLSDPALNQSIQAFNIGTYFGLRPDVVGRAVERLIGWVLEGAVRVPVTQVLPLERAAEAHRLLETRRSIGKIVLHPWE